MIKPKLSLYFIASFTVLLWRCSQPTMMVPAELQDPDAEYHGVLGKSLAEARADIKRTVLACGGGTCPQGIALMAVVGQSTSSDPAKRYFIKDPCTASFVKVKGTHGDEIFALTAGHCVPKRIKVGASCSDDISLVTSNGLRVVCDKVAFKMSDERDDVDVAYFDLALLKLKSSSVSGAYELNTAGLKAPGVNHGVTMLSVDHALDWNKSMTAAIREKECFYLQDSFVVPTSRGPRSPIFMNRDCNLHPGHSGAPLLEGGVVVGVQNDFIQFDPPIFAAGELALASNVSCFDARSLKVTCESAIPKLYRDKTGNLVHANYLNLVRSVFERSPGEIPTFDHDTQRMMQYVWEQEKSAAAWKVPNGFGDGWVYKDVKKDSEYYFRIPFPKCVSATLGRGNLGPFSAKVLLYGLKASRKVLNLALEAHAMKVDFELVYLGKGKFHLNTFLNPDGYLELEIPVCGRTKP